MTVSDEFSGPVDQDQPANSRNKSKIPQELPREDLYNLLHPKERSRAILVWISAAITGLVLVLVLVNFGFLLVVLAVVAGSIWLGKQLLYALFRGNAVEIGPTQFPDIHKRIVEATTRLGLARGVGAFVIHDGKLNAFFYNKSGRRLLVINSGMVEDMSSAELDFIILRFLGYLRARQIDLGSISDLIGILNAVPILGLLTKSYDRAAVLSGDRIGAYACGSTDTARSAMAKFAVGAKLQHQFSEATYLSQAHIFHQSPWNFLTRLWQDHPHFSDRMIELDDWINRNTSRTA